MERSSNIKNQANHPLFPAASKSKSFFTAKEHPKLCAYVERLEAMEAYKKAVQKIVEVEGKYEII